MRDNKFCIRYTVFVYTVADYSNKSTRLYVQ